MIVAVDLYGQVIMPREEMINKSTNRSTNRSDAIIVDGYEL